MGESDTKGKVLKKAVVWKNLYFYRKSDTLYQLTAEFCHRYLPAYGDRTVDQMVQAARSGKQNIIEGSEDGQTSSEMEIRLLNVARGSLQELRADYIDYLKHVIFQFGLQIMSVCKKCANFATHTTTTATTNLYSAE